MGRFNGRTRTLIALCAAVFAAFALAACGSDDDGGDGEQVVAAQDANANVGKGKALCAMTFVKVGTAVPLLQQLEDIAENTGMKFEEHVANGDFNAALKQIEACGRQGAGAIVTIATENAGAKSAIASASGAGVPVITEFGGPPVKGVDMAIHGDEAKGSGQLADWIAENLGDKLDIVLFTASPLTVVRDRTAGFEAAAKDHSGWNLLATEELDLADPAKSATEKTQAALERYPNVDLIVAPWDDPAAGSVSAVRASGDDTKVVTYDGVEATFALMRAPDSPLVALQAQPDLKASELVQEQLVRILQDEKPDARYYLCTGPVVTAENVPSPNKLVEGGTCVPER